MSIKFRYRQNIAFVFLFFVGACQMRSFSPIEQGESQIRVRMGHGYYSIYVNKNGQGQVVKGISSLHTDSFVARTFTKSQVFQINSYKDYWQGIANLRDNPYIDERRTDAARIEIFCGKVKIYDAFRWRESISDIIVPVMKILPNKFSPFRQDDDPFGKNIPE